MARVRTKVEEMLANYKRAVLREGKRMKKKERERKKEKERHA